jgi:hypothetical protein
VIDAGDDAGQPRIVGVRANGEFFHDPMMGRAGFRFKRRHAMLAINGIRADADPSEEKFRKTAMSEANSLYDQDFVAWSKEQAEALRAAARTGSNQKLDCENLAEEVEGLGISQRHALHSQLQRIIHHLLKLAYSPAMEPRRRWDESIADARSEIELLLQESPSLATDLEAAITVEFTRGARKAIRELEKYGEITPAALANIQATTFTPEQILGDWFPPEPKG